MMAQQYYNNGNQQQYQQYNNNNYINNNNQNNNNNNAQQEKNYGIKNQYHPKSSEELYDQRKAHIYQMKGSFDAEKGVLNVYVYDAMTKNEWEENFTQKNFQNLQLSE